MQETIDAGASAAELIDKAEVSNGQAIVTYSRTEAALADLREKYKDAKYDLTTTAGDKAARAARLELVTLRTDLEKKRKELKAPAIAFGKKIDSEADRITSEIAALEAPIDAQIKADEKRRDDERRAREEAEAARKKVHTDAIAKIAGYVARAAELPSDRVAGGIAFLEGLDLTGFEEYATEAGETRDRTVAALRTLQIKAKAREDEEARLQAERAEQARIAAEQAETARQLKAQQEELQRQRDEIEAARESIRAAEQRQREEAQAVQLQQEQEAAAREQQERQAEVDRTFAAAVTAAPAANVLPMPTKAPATAPTLMLRDINALIAPLSIDAAGLAALGFPPAATDKNAKMYHSADFPRMRAAMVDHLQAVQLQAAA